MLHKSTFLNVLDQKSSVVPGGKYRMETSVCVQEEMAGSVRCQAMSWTVHFTQFIYLNFFNHKMAVITHCWCCYYVCTLSRSASSRAWDPAGEDGIKQGSRGRLRVHSTALAMCYRKLNLQVGREGWPSEGKTVVNKGGCALNCSHRKVLGSAGRSRRPSLNAPSAPGKWNGLFSCAVFWCLDKSRKSVKWEAVLEPLAKGKGKKKKKRTQTARYQECRKLIYGGEVIVLLKIAGGNTAP